MRDSFEPTNGKVYIKDIVSDATMNNCLVGIMHISACTFTYSAPKAEAFKQGSLMQHLVQGGNHCCPPARVGICSWVQGIGPTDQTPNLLTVTE